MLQSLAQGETITQVYTVTITDNNGAPVSQDVTVTITGTNDAPTITSGTQTGAVTEIADNASGENIDTLHASGTVTFTDVDLIDTETSSIVTANTLVDPTLANGNTLTQAQQDALVNAFTIDAATHSTADGSGTIGWHYDIADSALDFLGANDQVQLTYTVQTDDGHGGTASQNVTITVHGTEDAPVITQATSGSFAEQAGTNNAGNDTASGSISFTDVDLSDRPTVTAPFDHYSYLAADGITALTLSPTQATALETALAIVPDGGNANDGSATWTYTVADNALDFLAQNETLTLTYLATVDDGQTGGVVTTPITVTITGTNDAPIITSSAVTGALQEDGNGTTTFQSLSNTLAATDADHNAQLTWSVADSGAVIGHDADYTFAIDNLTIVKDSTTIVNDDMSSAPVAGGGLYAVGVNGTPGTLTSGTDANGRTVTYLDATTALPSTSFDTGDPTVVNSAIRLTGTDGTGDTLTKESDFAVTGKFDLIAPNDIGESYGIRLTDRQPGVSVGDSFGGGISGNDTVELRVVEGYNGSVQVQFRQIDFTNGPDGSATTLQSFGLGTINAGDQIALTLSHSSSDPNAIVASYNLYDSSGAQLDANGSAAGLTRTFTIDGALFSDEDFTQAQIHAGSLATDLSYLANNYGAFSIDPNTGEWNYSLRNGSNAVQDLGPGSTPSVPQDFTVQVADDQGATATTTADFTVNGINDAPVLDLNGPSNSGINRTFTYTEGDGNVKIAALGTASRHRFGRFQRRFADGGVHGKRCIRGSTHHPHRRARHGERHCHIRRRRRGRHDQRHQ